MRNHRQPDPSCTKPYLKGRREQCYCKSNPYEPGRPERDAYDFGVEHETDRLDTDWPCTCN